MTLAVQQPTGRAVGRSSERPIVLTGVSWDFYDRFLRQLERSGQRLYLTFDRGTLEIMAPSPYHEKAKKLLAAFIEGVRWELDVPIASFGSTTYRREDMERGLEADECYYVQHEPQMGDRTTIDLAVDPPPDLAFEMDHSPHEIDRESVYAALGVPEIWVFDGRALRAYTRAAAGQYSPIDRSVAFPALRIADLERFLCMVNSKREDAIVREFRDWLRTIKPRPA